MARAIGRPRTNPSREASDYRNAALLVEKLPDEIIKKKERMGLTWGEVADEIGGLHTMTLYKFVTGRSGSTSRKNIVAMLYWLEA